MKKFIKKSLQFSLPILVLLVLIELLLRNIPNNYSYKKEYLDKHAKELEVLVMGSSHAYYGVNPVYIDRKSFNVANISQSLNYDLEILKQYDSRLTHLKYIVIPIDYFSFYRTLETGMEKWRVKNYNIYFGMNKSDALENNLEILNGKFKDNFYRMFKYYFRKKSDLSCSEFGWRSHNSKNKQDLIKTAIVAVKRHTKEDDSYFDRNKAILKEIIMMAKAKNVKVILYTSPANKEYVKRVEPNQMETTISTVSLMAKQNVNVKYFNLLNDKTFTDSDFFDADHFNEIGAKKFSIKLDSIINSNAKN